MRCLKRQPSEEEFFIEKDFEEISIPNRCENSGVFAIRKLIQKISIYQKFDSFSVPLLDIMLLNIISLANINPLNSPFIPAEFCHFVSPNNYHFLAMLSFPFISSLIFIPLTTSPMQTPPANQTL